MQVPTPPPAGNVQYPGLEDNPAQVVVTDPLDLPPDVSAMQFDHALDDLELPVLPPEFKRDVRRNAQTGKPVLNISMLKRQQ